MGQIATIGLDIAKSVFQVHGVDAEGLTVVRRRRPRRCPNDQRPVAVAGSLGPRRKRSTAPSNR